MKKHLFVTASLVLSSVFAFGAGFQLNLQGLRQLAMGGTGTAVPWDASTIFYNPGGLSRLDNIQAYVGAALIIPRTEYASQTTDYTTRSRSSVYTPINIYVGGPIVKNSRWGVGIGVYTPFGSGLTWNQNWSGRYVIQSIYLRSLFIQPTLSYRIGNVVSVGAGFIYATGKLKLQQAVPVQDVNGTDGEAYLDGDANGVGFNVGVQIHASDKLQFGLTYRSQVNMTVDGGSAKFNVPFSLQNEFPTTKFHSALPLPQVASFGIGWRPIHRLTFQLDLNYVGWNSYDSLRIDFSEHTSQLVDNHAPRHYQNTLAIRFGVNYDLNKKWALMAGAAYDPSPVTAGYVSPELPDGDRTVLSGGISYKPSRRFTIIGALEYSRTIERDATYNYGNFNGRYQTKAVVPGLAISYDF